MPPATPAATATMQLLFDNETTTTIAAAATQMQAGSAFVASENVLLDLPVTPGIRHLSATVPSAARFVGWELSGSKLRLSGHIDGLDAAAGDKEGAQVHPEGFQSVARMLRQSGLKLVLALEGGYHVGELDIRNVLSRGVEDVALLDADRFMGSGNFGKCLHAVAVALCES